MTAALSIKIDTVADECRYGHTTTCSRNLPRHGEGTRQRNPKRDWRNTIRSIAACATISFCTLSSWFWCSCDSSVRVGKSKKSDQLASYAQDHRCPDLSDRYPIGHKRNSSIAQPKSSECCYRYKKWRGDARYLMHARPMYGPVQCMQCTRTILLGYLSFFYVDLRNSTNQKFWTYWWSKNWLDDLLYNLCLKSPNFCESEDVFAPCALCHIDPLWPRGSVYHWSERNPQLTSSLSSTSFIQWLNY